MHPSDKQLFTGPLVPELPVADVERAQLYYRDVLGAEIKWIEPDKSIGAVSFNGAAIFFRRRELPFEPAAHWVYAPGIETVYEHAQFSGALIVDLLQRKPWGLKQFTIKDFDGNLFHFHE